MNIADLVILGDFNVDCNSRSFSRTKLKRLMNLHILYRNYTDYLGMMLIVHCALLKKIIMLINSQIIIETLKLHEKQ